MKWYIYKTNNIGVLSEYFDYNSIEYNDVGLWHINDRGEGEHTLSKELQLVTDSGLLIEGDIFNEIISRESSRQLLLDFLNRNNHLWVWSDFDGFNSINLSKDNIIQFDHIVPNHRICIFIDAEPFDDHWSRQLKNIRIQETKYNCLMRTSRIFNSYTDKINATKDFMLITVNKKARHHREVLWQELNSRPGLISKGRAIYRKVTDNWEGHLDNRVICKPLHISMDLYLDSWLEIVPERLYQDGYYFTEKTLKPIVTRTPFLMVSSRGYLEYLKSLGYQTFSSLIDEKYDLQDRIEDRTRLLVDQLENIIKNGSENFYRASRSILEHNYSKSAEISGRLQHDMDIIIRQCLDRIKSD
jgi:hypothetical protein